MDSNFLQERNEALFSLDAEKIITYCEKFDIPVPEDDNAFWGGVCKAILDIPEAPEDVRKRAAERTDKLDMTTISELNKQLTELTDEFLKATESGNVTEAFRWIVSTQEFLRGLLEETETMKHLTAREREIISEAEQANMLKRHSIMLLLQEHIRKEAQK